MAPLDSLASLHRPLVARLLRFATIGLFNTLAYFCLASFLQSGLGLATYWSSYLAYFILVPASFLGHKRFPFKSDGRSSREFGRFIAIQMLNLGIITASNLAAERFSGPSWATFVVISIAIPVANFIVFHWVFAAQRKA